MIIASTLTHLVESPARLDKFGSIPAAMGWATVALNPRRLRQRKSSHRPWEVLGGFIAFLRTGLFTPLTAALCSGFYEEVQRRKRERKEPLTCPYCGKKTNEL